MDAVGAEIVANRAGVAIIGANVAVVGAGVAAAEDGAVIMVAKKLLHCKGKGFRPHVMTWYMASRVIWLCHLL